MTEASSNPRIDTPGTRRGIVRKGAMILAIGVLLVLAPLALGPGMLNKYIVTAGLLFGCLGLSVMLNGLLDHLLKRR